MKRLSPEWRVCGGLEVNQPDETTLITEIQWHFFANGFLKLNNGWGLTTNATDFAPEAGLMLVFWGAIAKEPRPRNIFCCSCVFYERRTAYAQASRGISSPQLTIPWRKP